MAVVRVLVRAFMVMCDAGGGMMRMVLLLGERSQQRKTSDCGIRVYRICYISGTESFIHCRSGRPVVGVLDPLPLRIFSASIRRCSITRMLAVLNVLKYSNSMPASVNGRATE